MTEDEALSILRGEDAEAASAAEAALWRMWCQSGDPEHDRMLLSGIEAVERHELDSAERLFGELIERAAGFAEAWNKRATVRYLARDYRGAIADCEATLARKPHHFGALSGQGLCHMALGQHREAAAMFRRALAVHPHLDAVRNNLRLAIAEVVKVNGH